MTAHEHEILHLALACLALAAFLLGRYMWPHVPGLSARLDDAYDQGRRDVERTAVDRVEHLGLEFTLGPGGPYWRSRMFEPMPEPEPEPEPDWLAEPLSEAQERAASHLDLPGPVAPNLPQDRAGELLDWDAIRGHMTPLALLRMDGYKLAAQQEARLAAWQEECRAAWDLAKVAA